jgi:multiple sugar transport system substrate-binding protein
MSKAEKNLVSRRDMLRMAGVTGVGLLATACGGAATPQIVEVEKQVVVEKEVVRVETVEVEKVVEKEVIKEVEVEKIVEVEAMGDMATVEGALWILQKKDYHPAYNDYIRSQVAAYSAEHDWPLDMSYMSGFSSGTGDIEKITASVQAGDPPDLILHDEFIAVQTRNLYLVQPVTDVVEAVEANYGSVAPYIKILQYLDDQWWAVPYQQRAGGGYYRRDVFEAAGIDLQKTRTYDLLREQALEISDPDNEMYGWGITVNRSGDGNSIIFRFKTGWGAGFQDETGQFVRTNSPEMVEAMTELTNTYLDEKYAPMLPPGVLAWNDISNNEAYLGGIIAYTENAGTVYAKAVIDENPVAPLTGYLAQPGGPVNQEFNALGGQYWYVMRGAKNTEAAKQLALEFTGNLERMDGMLASSPAYALPAYTDLWEMSEYIKTNDTALQAKPAALDPAGISAEFWPGPQSAAMVGIRDSGIMNDMVNSILTGTAVEDSVAQAHDRMVLVFKEFGLPGEEV